LFRPALGPTQPPIQWVPGLSRGVKRPGCGIDHPPPHSTQVTERVELYLYSTSGPSWPVIGWTLPSFYLLFTFTFTFYYCLWLFFLVSFGHQPKNRMRNSSYHQTYGMQIYQQRVNTYL